MGALPPNPCQRDIVPLASHYSMNDNKERAEIQFSALFVDVHREAQRKFWSSFFKSLRSPEAESLVAVRRQRNSLFVQLIRMGGMGGNPIKGFPPIQDGANSTRGFGDAVPTPLPKGHCPFGIPFSHE